MEPPTPEVPEATLDMYFVNTTGVISVADITANGGVGTGDVGGNAASIEVFSWDDLDDENFNAVQLNGVLSTRVARQ